MVQDGLPEGASPVRVGEVLAGKYRVDRILGVGGMGIVVAATHLQLDQQVALKFMLPEALRLPMLVERFAREARAAVRLRSDHVARVLDVGTLESGSPFMVMEYLRGSDLGSLIEGRGAVPVDRAVDFVLQACDAVAEAHSLGIIHRDLKPRNLFLTERNDGRALVKVLDFGIAKQKAAVDDLALTKTTEVMGSPNYMSPEQLRASKLADERSDIWALGVILYELLTGVLPFAAESVTQLIAMVLTEQPRPLRGLRSGVPSQLVEVVERCLRKDPAARFASIAGLAAALEPFAPEDSRGLAKRIARIAAGSRPSPTQPASRHLVRAPSGTTGSSWTRTESGRRSRARAIALGVVATAVLLTGLVGVFAFVKLSRRSGQASEAAAPSASVASFTAAAPEPPSSLPATSATAAAVSSPPAADAGPVRVVRPRRDVPVPAVSGQVNEAPRYRTTW
jgi:serine/threonine protein kinase